MGFVQLPATQFVVEMGNQGDHGIAILELDFLCIKSIGIWKPPPMRNRNNFITIVGFKITQACRVHYLDSLDFVVLWKIYFLQATGVLKYTL